MTLFQTFDLSHNDKIQMLENFEWSDDLNAVQLGTFVDYIQSIKVPAGTTILQEGQIHSFFCLICEGHVDIVKENVLGKRKEIQLLGPGKTFGEMSFFDGEACSASVIAKEDVLLFVIDKKNFATLCNNSPSIILHITLHMLASVSRRLRQTTGRLVDLL